MQNQMSGPQSEYLVALCTAAQENGESFGIAFRIGALTSTFEVEATKMILSILSYSPAKDSVAVEFLNALATVTGMLNLVMPVMHHTSQFNPTAWATEVMDFLSNNFITKDERSKELNSVTNLASEMLTHLIIATRNPGGKKTPQESLHPTPDITRLQQIRQLSHDAITHRNQSALKELIFLRDGFRCPFTLVSFARNSPTGHVVPRTAHILPFSFHDKPLTLSTLETFTGRKLSAEVIKNINHPCNAFNAESNTHESYNNLAWGIEAVSCGNEWKYYFRSIREIDIAPFIRLSDGDEIVFGCGDPHGQTIDKPNPEYCNIKLALARVMNACGAAGMIMEFYGDDDDDDEILNLPVYMGGPFVSDDILFHRLEARLLT